MPKTTLRVHKKRWELFQNECLAFPLRRDAYLNRILPGEIAILAEIPACDDEGFQWLKKTWNGKDGPLRDEITTHVAVTLTQEVIDVLNETCSIKRVPRDAFFHCFLEFITTRLYQAAVVIKDPRTTRDVASQIADMMTDEDTDDNNRRDHLLEIAQELYTDPQLAILHRDHYRDVLSYDKQRASEEMKILALSL